MGFEPQKFFIGLMDFFSILLPGALLTYTMKDQAARVFLNTEASNLTGPEGWIVFAVSSYLLGHFLFLIGSWLLDDIYDSIRRATYAEQIRRLASGEALPSLIARFLAANLFESSADRTLRQAVRIKELHLDPQRAAAINAFQWSKARLALKHPEAIASIQRFEADSKFFRSLVILLAILIVWAAFESQPFLGISCAIGLVVSFWRFADQRMKSINQSYWYIITLEGEAEKPASPAPAADPNRPTHAGGVVYRTGRQPEPTKPELGSKQPGSEKKKPGPEVTQPTVNKPHTEFLIVQAKNAPHEWVLPKGHVEADEPEPETAVREVREEAGVWARVKKKLRTIHYEIDGTDVQVRFYLMEALAETQPREKRVHAWLPADQAIESLSHQQSRELIVLAEQAVEAF